MTAEARMKAEKVESQVHDHLDSPAEYIRYWNERCAEDVAQACRQIGELPTRVVKRKQVSEARAKGKLSRSKQSIEEEEENDESQWSRRGQSLVESNSLRRDLMAMEKRSDRTTIKDVYNNFMGWLQEEKGMSREDVLKADAMACSTFGRWYGEQKQELSTNKRWRENIAAYIAQHIDSK